MTYLVIMVLLAGAGIFRLWLQQRRERSHLDTVDGFKAGLEAISTPTPRPSRVTPAPGRSRSERPMRTAAPATISASNRSISAGSTSLDPARREAAKRRLEARRRSVHRSA
jgi:hypothetical protein